MREFFSQFGKVVDSTVMLDRETGRSKGFGFVSFEDTDVTPFLGFGNLEIDGKLVGFHLPSFVFTFLMCCDRLMSSSLSPAPNAISLMALVLAAVLVSVLVLVLVPVPATPTRISI